MLKTSVVIQTQFVGDDKGHLRVLQTLPEKQQTPHAAIAVLEWMDTLETHMEIQNIVERNLFECVVVRQQNFYMAMNLFGRDGLLFAYLVGKAFVVPHGEPWFAAF